MSSREPLAGGAPPAEGGGGGGCCKVLCLIIVFPVLLPFIIVACVFGCLCYPFCRAKHACCGGRAKVSRTGFENHKRDLTDYAKFKGPFRYAPGGDMGGLDHSGSQDRVCGGHLVSWRVAQQQDIR